MKSWPRLNLSLLLSMAIGTTASFPNDEKSNQLIVTRALTEEQWEEQDERNSWKKWRDETPPSPLDDFEARAIPFNTTALYWSCLWLEDCVIYRPVASPGGMGMDATEFGQLQPMLTRYLGEFAEGLIPKRVTGAKPQPIAG